MFLLYPHSPSFWLIFHQMKHWQSCLRPILPLKANGHSLEAEIWKEQENDPPSDLASSWMCRDYSTVRKHPDCGTE